MTIADIYTLFQETSIVSTDTRTVKQGSIFFALKGAHFNGNEFAKDALEKGASYAIIDDCRYQQDKTHYICVSDVLETLQKLAEYHILQLGIPVVGITGTNGKTTTKELVKEVLSQKYKVSATQGNLNNHIGVPLTLLAISPDIEIAIVEMGASKQGDIQELCDIAHPTNGLITNIGVAHIEGFGSSDAIFHTKTELLDSVVKNEGDIFINTNIKGLNERYASYTSQKKHLYGTNSYIKGEVIHSNPFLEMKIMDGKQEIHIKSTLIGHYNLENILAAYVIGKHFQVEISDIQQAIESYQPNINRSQYIETDTNKIIADAYNANPSSMKVALSNFFAIESSEEKMLILGDMLELGEFSEQAHNDILALIDSNKTKIEAVLLVGAIFSKLAQNQPYIKAFQSIDDAINDLKTNTPKNKLILLKGSRGIALEKLIPYLS